MMLVKIGQVYINFDQVHYIRDPGGLGSGAPLTIEFTRGQPLVLQAQVDTLRQWLASNSTNVLPPVVPPAPTST